MFKETSIEIETYQALTDLCIQFEKQKSIGNLIVDAYIPILNLVVECQGDFWHCNPKMYPEGPNCKIQREHADRDPARIEELEFQGYHVLELWESDIKEFGARALIEEMIDAKVPFLQL